MLEEVESEGSCINHGDTAWLLISTALVMLMVPGLAMFEAGTLRAKNTISVFTQTLGGFCMLTICWYSFSYISK